VTRIRAGIEFILRTDVMTERTWPVWEWLPLRGCSANRIPETPLPAIIQPGPQSQNPTPTSDSGATDVSNCWGVPISKPPFRAFLTLAWSACGVQSCQTIRPKCWERHRNTLPIRARRNQTLTCTPQELLQLGETLLRVEDTITRQDLSRQLIEGDFLDIASFFPTDLPTCLFLTHPTIRRMSLLVREAHPCNAA